MQRYSFQRRHTKRAPMTSTACSPSERSWEFSWVDGRLQDHCGHGAPQTQGMMRNQESAASRAAGQLARRRYFAPVSSTMRIIAASAQDPVDAGATNSLELVTSVVHQEDSGMARPASAQPTDGELEILKVLWRCGPVPVGQVHAEVARHRPAAAR